MRQDVHVTNSHGHYVNLSDHIRDLIAEDKLGKKAPIHWPNMAPAKLYTTKDFPWIPEGYGWTGEHRIPVTGDYVIWAGTMTKIGDTSVWYELRNIFVKLPEEKKFTYKDFPWIPKGYIWKGEFRPVNIGDLWIGNYGYVQGPATINLMESRLILYKE